MMRPVRASALLASALLALASPLSAQTPGKNLAPFNPPADSDIPSGPLGDSIRLGQEVLTQTQQCAKGYVGNGLNCTSCHLNGGRTQHAAPWVGLWAVFPEYRSRNAQVNALEERVNDCFRRSMNGKPLPYDSPEMVGILAYVWWLSKGVPTGMEVEGRGFQRIQLPAGPEARPGERQGGLRREVRVLPWSGRPGHDRSERRVPLPRGMGTEVV
jgi:thiosulfate dehydrogenase